MLSHFGSRFLIISYIILISRLYRRIRFGNTPLNTAKAANE